MPDRPFDNPWPSPPVIGDIGGAPAGAPVYYDPAYINAVLAPSIASDEGYTPGAVPPDTGVQQGDVAGISPGAVGDAYWGGGGYVGEDFYDPSRGQLSRTALNRLLGEKSTGGWPGYGVIGSLSNLFYRRVRRTPMGIARKLLDTLIRQGVRAVANRMNPRIPIPPGTLPGSGGRALIPYEPFEAIPSASSGLTVGLAAIAGVLALMYPRGMFSSGERPIQPWERTGGSGPAGRVLPRSDIYTDYGFPLAPGGFSRGAPPTNAIPENDFSPPNLGPGGIPAPPGSPAWRQRFEQRLQQRVQRSKKQLEQRIEQMIPQALNQGPPAPYDSGIEGYTPPKQVTITPQNQRPAKAPGVIRWGQLVGAIGAGTAIEALRSNRSSLTSTPSSSLSSSSSTNMPTVSTSSSPTLIYGGSAGFGTGSESCSCGKRGPRRKCLERAPVSWRGGRNKGKAAGTKCVRFASRRTA